MSHTEYWSCLPTLVLPKHGDTASLSCTVDFKTLPTDIFQRILVVQFSTTFCRWEKLSLSLCIYFKRLEWVFSTFSINLILDQLYAQCGLNMSEDTTWWILTAIPLSTYKRYLSDLSTLIWCIMTGTLGKQSLWSC
jgi:hypothetical protein